jgi:hypothetical protein
MKLSKPTQFEGQRSIEVSLVMEVNHIMFCEVQLGEGDRCVRRVVVISGFDEFVFTGHPVYLVN